MKCKNKRWRLIDLVTSLRETHSDVNEYKPEKAAPDKNVILLLDKLLRKDKMREYTH